jgi:anti-sigma regulatory factor (Ser/Thr protein kinase)
VSKAPNYPRERAGVALELERSVHAPAAARAAMKELGEELELERQTMQTLVLLVSEVVSNAVLHCEGPSDAPILLEANASDEVLRIIVTDAGSGFTPTERDPQRIEGGYGLYLLGRAASRWGVEERSPTSVWFELDLPE